MSGEDIPPGQHPFDACAYCGASLELGTWYPVEDRNGPAAESELYSFCNEECQAAWTAEN